MKFILSIFCLLLFVSSSFAQQDKTATQNKPDFSGIWLLNFSQSDFGMSKGHLIYDALTLVISHQTPELKVTRKWAKKKKEQTRELVYYTDGRGEKNSNFNKNEIVTSKTNWDGNILTIKGTSSLMILNNVMTSDITEKWELSADGQTLLQIIKTDAPRYAFPGVNLGSVGPRTSRKVFKKSL